MHLLLIHQAFVSPREPGGTRHYELARRFVDAGHRFTIVASDLSYLTGKRTDSADAEDDSAQPPAIRIVRARTIPTLHRSYIWRVVSFLSFMVQATRVAVRIRDVDLVLGTSPPIFQAVSAWLVSWIRRKPFVLEVRDLWPEFAVDMGVLRNRLLIALARWLESFLYARSRHIVVNSPAYRDYLIRRGVPAEKISFIANGVDPAMFLHSDPSDDIRAEFGLQDKFVVTYAGAMGQANDLDTLLDAAERLRDHADIHWLLVGDGKERPRLEQEARRRGLANVTFAGSRPKQAMPAILRSSDACVAILRDIPMFRTTYPNKVFDYMAAGRPTVLAIDGVIREVVEAAGGGIAVPPGNAQALAQAVLALRNDPHSCRTMGERARQYVARHFNRNDQAARFIALTDRLAQRKAA